MELDATTKAILATPQFEMLKTLWARQNFKMFATTPKGTNFRQIEAFNDLVDDSLDEILFGGGARGGKSFLGCTWILFNCLTMPESAWLIVRKDLTRIKDTTVPTMLKVLKNYGVPTSEYEIIGANTGATIRFNNGSIIYFRGGGYDPNDKDFNRFGSYDLTGVFLEECQELTFKLVSVLRGRFSVLEGEGWKTKPKILMTCNPAKTWIYSLFYDAQRKGTILSYRKFIKALVTDNPNVSEDYILSLQKSDEITKQRLLYGNFDYDDDATALTTMQTCQAVFTNDYVKTDLYDKKIIIDPALGGKDGCGINVFYGLSCVERITFDKLTPAQFIFEVKKVQARHGVMNHKMIFDAVGIGALSSANFPNAVMFTANASVIWKPDPAKAGTERANEDKPPFDNLKSQCGFRLAEYINEGKIFYKCRVSEEDKQSIIEQIGQLKRRDLIADKRIGLIPKEEIKVNIGYSPTDLDMLQMLMYFEIMNQYNPPRKALKSFVVEL
jgi:hypothetical protein